MRGSELQKYFDEQLFIPEMEATTKNEALEELLNLFIDMKHIRNRQIVLEMLHTRETLGSTGIGKGIAIPHGRTTAVSDVLIAFGKSEAGIDFDAMDGKPVHLFFMVIAPPHEENNVYLPILGTLVTALNNKKNRDELKKISTFEEFLAIITGE